MNYRVGFHLTSEYLLLHVAVAYHELLYDVQQIYTSDIVHLGWR